MQNDSCRNFPRPLSAIKPRLQCMSFSSLNGIRNTSEPVIRSMEYDCPESTPILGKQVPAEASPGPRRNMTISITLTPEHERQLEELARQNGKDAAAYVNDVVAAYLDGVRSTGEKTFEEILTPIWEGWRQSGMTEDEIDEMFRREVQEVRRERRQQSGTT
jgi:hypothetical protein